eukprot:TRINITY_DN1517_c0_g1_i1.p1 TRINITY_DN1517_c0_g1~~TRINITY_DN1517_c0_g1_i1.p1  ORF type:complete len:472 (-),score=82.81 TRINITY_DN1517_c0_g1_i1:533-1903(-)
MVKSLEEHSPSGGPGVIFDGNILDSKVTQKIGSINRDGRLRMPIQFMKVAPSLGKVTVDRAMQILDQLSRNAPKIEDSTEFIINSAENGGPDVVMNNPDGMHRGFGGCGGCGGFGGGGNALALTHPSAGSDGGAFNMGSMSDAQRSGFKQVLCRYFEKGCQKGDACQFAHGLHELRNPVIAAAAGDDVTKESVDHTVRTAIARCNKHPQITQSIHFKQVAPVLAMLEVPVALALLEELYSIIPTIKNPTSWLSAAATRKATGEERPGGGSSKGKGKGKGGKGGAWGDGWGDPWEAMGQMFSAFLDSWGKGDGKGGKGDAGWGDGWGKGDKGGKGSKGSKGGGYGSGCPALAQQWTYENQKDLIGKTVGYYNKQGDLLTPINYAELCPLLLQLEPDQARSVLASIDGKQQSIGNPTKWLAKAATKYAQGPPPMSGMGGYGGEPQPPSFGAEAASFGF